MYSRTWGRFLLYAPVSLTPGDAFCLVTPDFAGGGPATKLSLESPTVQTARSKVAWQPIPPFHSAATTFKCWGSYSKGTAFMFGSFGGLTLWGMAVLAAKSHKTTNVGKSKRRSNQGTGP